jgi:quercetin dioxygenase-like cupin family protein
LAGAGNRVDLEEVATSVGERAGVVWTLGAGEDLNANLVRFGPGRGVREHANEEVDLLVLGVSGSGAVVVDGEEHALESGKLVFVPKGSRRSIRSASEGFAYLTVHRRRGPPDIGRRGDQALRKSREQNEDA